MFRVIAILASIVAVVAFAPRTIVSRASTLQMANIVDTASKAGSFKTQLRLAGLEGVLSGPGPMSVFAPTDAAFDKLPRGTLDALLKDTNKLKSILTYHVVSKEVMPRKNGPPFRDCQRKDIACKIRVLPGKSLMESIDVPYIFGGQANAAKVETMGIKCDNGLIHVIDEVLIPYEGNSSEGPFMNLKF